MFKLLLLFLLLTTTTIVTAQEKPLEIMDKELSTTYPFAYAALGNIIYENAPKINKLQEIEVYEMFQKKIKEYIEDVNTTMKEGFLLNEQSSMKERKNYLNRLRDLAVTNDFFVRSVDDKFSLALEKEDTELFTQLLESELVDIDRYRDDILKYYYEHQEDMIANEIIEKLIEDEQQRKAKTTLSQKKYKSKRQKELERIREIRAKDKKEQERLEKELQKELEKKKQEIREYQKEELSKTK